MKKSTAGFVAPATAFQVHLSIEALDTGKIIAKASLTIRQPSPNRFTIQD